MKRILTVGLRYRGDPIDGVEFDNLGLCSAATANDKAAYPLYEYDVIVIHPASFSQVVRWRFMLQPSCTALPRPLEGIFAERPRARAALALLRVALIRLLGGQTTSHAPYRQNPFWGLT